MCPSINDSGQVAAVFEIAGGTTTRGLFVDSGGVDSAIALVGDVAPGTDGGVYTDIDLNFSSSSSSMNSDGDVVFHADVANGSASHGIFVDSGGTQSAVALLGDPAPGIGDFYTWLGGSSINESGDVAFLAGAGSISGIFVDSGGTDLAVAVEGELAPGSGGGTYSFFGVPEINAAGPIAFPAAIEGGNIEQAIYIVPEPSQPIQLIAGFAMLGVLRRWHQSRKSRRPVCTRSASS